MVDILCSEPLHETYLVKTLLNPAHKAGVEEVAETLQELWISYNLLSSLKGVEKLTKLRVRGAGAR